MSGRKQEKQLHNSIIGILKAQHSIHCTISFIILKLLFINHSWYLVVQVHIHTIGGWGLFFLLPEAVPALMHSRLEKGLVP